jgi:hypothetical protein
MAGLLQLTIKADFVATNDHALLLQRRTIASK